MPWTKGTLLWVRHGREPGGTVFVLRKRLGNAVRRNRLKRRLRHICRGLSLPADASLVVLAQPAAMSTSFDRLQDELTRLVDGLGASERTTS